MRQCVWTIIGLCLFGSVLVSGWHQAVNQDDAYPLAENTPANLIGNHGIRMRYAGGAAVNRQLPWPAADCAALALELHQHVTGSGDLNTSPRMYGVMVTDVDTPQETVRHIHIARSGWTLGGSAAANAMIGIAAAMQNEHAGATVTYVEATPAQKNEVCYWARTTRGRTNAGVFTAQPQTCQPHVEPTPDWEYLWTMVKKDVARKVQYRHTAGVNAYTWTEEISNPIGACAGTKLALRKPVGGTIRCLAERYFTNVPGGTVTVNHFTIPNNLADQNYGNTDLTPSCSTCQSIIPNILDNTISGWIANHPLPNDHSGDCKDPAQANNWPGGNQAAAAKAALVQAQGTSRAINAFIGQPNDQCARPVVIQPQIVVPQQQRIVRSKSVDDLKKKAPPVPQLVRKGSGGLKQRELEPMNE